MTDKPLDYFLHIGGTPMIVLGDILIRDDIQQTISTLLDHVGSPSFPDSSSDHRSSKSRRSLKSRERSHHSSKPRSQSSQLSSIGSRTGTHVSVPTRESSPMIESHTLSDPAPLLPNIGGNDDPVTTPITSNPLISILTTPIAHLTARSVRFPNVVDTSVPHRTTSTSQSDAPRITILHGHQGTPMQTSVPAPTPRLRKGSPLQSDF